MIDVLFIHPSPNLEIDILDLAFPFVQPGYGMLYVATYLEKYGYKTEVFNAALYHMLKGNIEDILQTYSPKVVGIELNWVHYSRGAIQTAKIIKKLLPDAHVVIGGTHSSVFAEHIIEVYSRYVDSIIVGEAEKPFLDLVEKVDSGQELKDISGLVKKEKGKPLSFPVLESKMFQDVDEIPVYSPQLIKPMTRARVAAINTCRGMTCVDCPDPCSYCFKKHYYKRIKRKNFLLHSTNWVIDQIKRLVEYGTTQIVLGDGPPFGNGFLKKFYINLSKGLVKEKLNQKLELLVIDGTPGAFNHEVVKALSELGICEIDYWLATGSREIASKIESRITPEMMVDSVKTMAKYGILPRLWVTVGHPYETRANVDETLTLIRHLYKVGGMPLWISPTLLTPFTDVFNHPEKFGVKLRHKTFEDFMVFSDIKRREDALYPELVTFETESFSTVDILSETNRIRKFIYDNQDEILEFVLSHYPHFSGERKKRVKSYPNLTMSSIL